ncbi:GNAT family N-acetyltransferase [Lysinibacillus sp. M3]|uniref:GNAT family N-acetyltransferase n=1 Tax=Lysinibacillus zambalensis TaxID=3160866 RepID=A0ABV1MRL3_9BACI
MNIILAQAKDASAIHNVMLQAFKEYEHATPPSSALSETIESIEQAMEKGEHAFIGYIDKQGRGLATALIEELEQFACMKRKLISECKVRMSVPRNIELYRSLGYVVTKEDKEENRNGFALSVATKTAY